MVKAFDEILWHCQVNGSMDGSRLRKYREAECLSTCTESSHAAIPFVYHFPNPRGFREQAFLICYI